MSGKQCRPSSDATFGGVWQKCTLFDQIITKTCLYNFDPNKSHFYIVKLGLQGYTLFFLFLLKNIDCGFSLEPPHRGGSNQYLQSMFWAEIRKISEFFIWNRHILVVKFLLYLNRRVFMLFSLNSYSLYGVFWWTTVTDSRHEMHDPCGPITKTRLFRYIENFTSKNWKCSDKKLWYFHISAQNIDCGYSLEPPRRGGSNEYPQSMFLSRNKKNNVYPCKPQFYYIKVGFKGVKII